MTRPDPYLLPHPATLPFPVDHVEFLLGVLDRFVGTPNGNPAAHYRATYRSASRRLAETYPNCVWESNYRQLCTRLATTGAPTKQASADDLLLATLTAYGRASDRRKDRDEWVAAAEQALELYRNRRITPLMHQYETPAAVVA